jgi:AICAR transformylase/IMP cyclohydrolase PurH
LPNSRPEIRTAALFSLFDKTGVAELATELHDRGVEIYATGAAFSKSTEFRRATSAK